jgi:hypothetical protein
MRSLPKVNLVGPMGMLYLFVCSSVRIFHLRNCGRHVEEYQH